MKKPKLIAFDLDYTLWPFWVDTHVSLPCTKNNNGEIIDNHKNIINCYPEVHKIIERLYNENYSLAIASRTSEINGANQLLQLFGWDKYFKYKEIYPGSKTTHFKNFRKNSGIEFSEMLFFDDEQRNIIDLDKIGVVSILVPNGVNEEIIDKGLNEFNRRHSNR